MTTTANLNLRPAAGTDNTPVLVIRRQVDGSDLDL